MSKVELTFFLKGVDPEKLIKDYQAGYFNRPAPKKNKLVNASQNSIMAQTYSDNIKDAVFTVKDRHNIKIIMATEGHVAHDNFVQTNGSLRKGGRCKCCMEDYDHMMPGYPIAHEEHTILSVETKKYQIMHVFWTMPPGNACSFECLSNIVNNNLSRPLTHRDSASAESSRLLKLMYRLIYPDAGPLIAANDPGLLINQNGSLTSLEWKDRRHKYVRTERLLIIPAKTEYMRQQIALQ